MPGAPPSGRARRGRDGCSGGAPLVAEPGHPVLRPNADVRWRASTNNISAKPEPRTTAETEGGPRWNGRRHFLGLGAERYRRNQQVIIDAEPPEPDRSRKG